MLEVAALGISLVAFLFSAAQFITRQRPYVCVTSLESLPDTDNWLRVNVANLGELPAKALNIRVDHPVEQTEQSWGVLFPGQKFAIDCREAQYERLMSFRIAISITYRGPISFGIGRVGYGIYHTTQGMAFATNGQWWVGAGDFS